MDIISRGEMTAIMKSAEVMMVSYDTAFEYADNEGWQPVMEDNGSPRAIKTDRIIEGYISSERWDSQNDKVPLTAFVVEKDNEGEMPLIEYIAKRAPLVYEHANTEKGVVVLGLPVAWKVENERPKFRWAIYKGSDLVDECWAEMKKHGKSGGFSIGGAKVDSDCENGHCLLNKLDIVEVSWTPTPANQDAKCTYVSKADMDSAEKGPPFEPPPSGDLPAKGKEILDKVYSDCRSKQNSDSPENKEKCAKIAWGAVKRAGYSPGTEKAEDEEDEEPQGEPMEKPCHWKKKAIDILDKYWNVKDPTPSQKNPPKLGPDREIMELEEDGEDQEEKGCHSKKSVDDAWADEMAKFKITKDYKSALSRARRKKTHQEG